MRAIKPENGVVEEEEEEDDDDENEMEAETFDIVVERHLERVDFRWVERVVVRVEGARERAMVVVMESGWGWTEGAKDGCVRGKS